MYKAVIVDDEKMIRTGMRKVIPWDTLGIGEVFAAKSGRDALKIIKEHRPEIMITDIMMDEMTGLKLIEKAQEWLPDIRILVLTGHDKFEYARECIKLKVHDFFLKPIDEEDLINAIKKQILFLNQKSVNHSMDPHTNRARAVTEQMRIERFLRDLIHHRVGQKNEETVAFCKKYNYAAAHEMQVALIVPPLCDEGTARNYTAMTMKNICIGLVDAQNRGLTFTDDEGRIVIAFFVDPRQRSILEWIREINDILRDEYNKSPKMIVGNPVSGMGMLDISYGDAIELLQHEKYEIDGIIQTKNAWEKNIQFREIFMEIKNEMGTYIEDCEKILNDFDRFQKATDCYNLSDSYIRKCCFELVLSIYYDNLSILGEDTDMHIRSFTGSLMGVYGDELFIVTRSFLANLLGNKENQSVHDVIDKAKRYITDTLSEDLSVSKIASCLYVTPNYLSRLFKKVTGEGCNEYIIRKRIEKAKQLLETTNLKASKIAVLVGYHDTNYFSLAFKKNTGMSPTKYREAYRLSGVCP